MSRRITSRIIGDDTRLGRHVAERGANYSDKAPTESGEFAVKSDTKALDGLRGN